MEIAKSLLTVGSLIGARKAIRAIYDFDPDDVLGIVGLQRRAGWPERVLPSIGLAIVSAAVGAGVALLLAPSSGVELRQRISSSTTGMKEQTKQRMGEFKSDLKRDRPMHNS